MAIVVVAILTPTESAVGLRSRDQTPSKPKKKAFRMREILRDKNFRTKNVDALNSRRC